MEITVHQDDFSVVYSMLKGPWKPFLSQGTIDSILEAREESFIEGTTFE